MADDNAKKSKWKNIFAIIAFILLLLIGIWSAVQVISYIPRLFSKDTSEATHTTLRLGNKDIVMALTPQNAMSGNDVHIEWERKGNDEGVMSFSYACTDGFYFTISGSPVPCNAPFTMTPTTRELIVVPHTDKESVDAPVAITYTNAANESVRATETLTVVRNPLGETTESTTSEDSVDTDETTTATTPAATPTTTSSGTGPIEPTANTATTKPTYVQPTMQTVRIPRASNPYGVADLHITGIKTGMVNAYGNFSEQYNVSKYDRGAAVFTIQNAGTKETGIWYFSANVPSQGGYTFNSQPQPTIMPGGVAEILITFDQLYPGTRAITVHADSYNAIPESNEYNNSITGYLTILGF